MRMSDHFPEAFQVEHNKSFEVQDATWYSYGEKYESDSEQDSAIEHAVLNHDRLQQENAELREALVGLMDCNGILTSDKECVIRAKQILNKND